MKATLSCLAALVLAAAVASTSHAGQPNYYNPFPGYAPDMCAPGFICTNSCGWYGQYWYVRPAGEPFNGFRPDLSAQQNAGPMGFPVHPFARSPRDYFMMDR